MTGNELFSVLMSAPEEEFFGIEELFETLFNSVLDCLKTDMYIFGYNLNLWQFLVVDVCIVGFSYVIGRGLLGGRG